LDIAPSRNPEEFYSMVEAASIWASRVRAYTAIIASKKLSPSARILLVHPQHGGKRIDKGF
jgi:hypothetical protein